TLDQGVQAAGFGGGSQNPLVARDEHVWPKIEVRKGGIGLQPPYKPVACEPFVRLRVPLPCGTGWLGVLLKFGMALDRLRLFSFQFRKQWHLAIASEHGLGGEVVIEVLLEPFREHEFPEHGSIDAVSEAARVGNFPPDGERVQKPLYLPRVSLRSFRENRPDLLRENEC